jgi:DDE superfamily endonuclease
LCHLDEAGFAMTLPTSYSWSPVGERLTIAYEAPQGRRLNVLGAYFSHGPQAGHFVFECWAKVPEREIKGKSLAGAAARHGVPAEAVGTITGERFVAFLWQVAGRPAGAAAPWQRERPLWIVLDNYSVHHGEELRAALPALRAAGVQLWYLPAYSPELSDIEPIWRSVKHHDLPQRSFKLLGDLKQAVEVTLAQKAAALRVACEKTDHLLPLAA